MRDVPRTRGSELGELDGCDESRCDRFFCEKLTGAMPFFFIVPLWLVCLTVGSALLFGRRSRKIGQFVIAVSTGATLVSLALSTGVLYLLPHLLPQPSRSWYGVLLVTFYAGAVGVGALAGGAAGFWAVFRFKARG